MLKLISRFLLAVIVASLFLGSEALAAVRPDRKKGEYIIQLRPDLNADNAANALDLPATMAGSDIEVISKSRKIIKLKLPANLGPAVYTQVTKALSSRDTITRWEPNYLYYAVAEPQDEPRLNDLWYLDKVKAIEAWDLQADSPNITVAIIDTGVFLQHEDLQANLIQGKDFANDDDDPSPGLFPVPIHPFFCGFDPNEYPDLFSGKAYEAHGTHVAGTIGAELNGKGIIGISRKVKLMPLKFLDGPCGSGDLADALKCLEYAIDKKVNVINNSWGGPYSVFLKEEFEEANLAGILVVNAAGNENNNNDDNPGTPSGYNLPNMISVGASTRMDGLASFSNFGDSTNIAAPGVDIVSCVPLGDQAQPQSGYASFNGTSMAAPIVTATAALVMAKYPDLSHIEVRELILTTADSLPSLQGRVAQGRRLNVLKALEVPPLPLEITNVLNRLPQPMRKKITEAFTPTDRVRMHLKPASKQVFSLFSLTNKSTESETGEQSQMTQATVLVSFKPKQVFPAEQWTSGEITMTLTRDQKSDLNIKEVDLISKRRDIFELQIETSLSEDELLNRIRKIPEVRMAEMNKKFYKK